jgi:hypothetical protein
MRSTEATLTELVPAPPDAVRGFYVDLNNIRLVHPLVTSVRTIARRDTADGYVQDYRVTDRIPLRLFTLRVTYAARLHVPVAGDVVAEARQFPRVRLHSVVTFEQFDGGTRIVERMRITAPRLLAAVTTREAVKAHTAMLAGIRRRFEQPGD